MGLPSAHSLSAEEYYQEEPGGGKEEVLHMPAAFLSDGV